MISKEEEAFLLHYGVKGMRWGVRRAERKAERKREAADNYRALSSKQRAELNRKLLKNSARAGIATSLAIHAAPKILSSKTFNKAIYSSMMRKYKHSSVSSAGYTAAYRAIGRNKKLSDIMSNKNAKIVAQVFGVSLAVKSSARLTSRKYYRDLERAQRRNNSRTLSSFSGY